MIALLLPAVLYGADIEAMDLDEATDVVAEMQADGTLDIEWYPLDTSQNFTLLIRNIGTGAEVEINVGNTTSYTAGGYDVNAEYEVFVLHDVYRTPGETVLFQAEPLGTAPGDRTDLALTLTQEIVKLDLTQFPRNVLTSVVNDMDDGSFIHGLNSTSYWEVTENGVVMTDCFGVADSAGFSIVDFVFLIDCSGSMSGEIAAVKNNVKAFADSLVDKGWDFRLCLVRFGSMYDPNQDPVLRGCTDDVDTFKGWLDEINVGGRYERGILAVETACEQFDFRPGSQRHFVLITDEDSDSPSPLSEACACCNSKDITVHVAVRASYGTTVPDYIDGIAACTGGLVFDVWDPYDEVLEKIEERIRNVYFITYCTPNTDCDGLERIVELTVSYEGQTATDTRTYIPCACPEIELTPETEALSDTPLPHGSSVLIAAHATDSYSPYVQWVNLYYRTTGASDYTVASMSLVSGDHEDGIWHYTVVGVSYPGLDYYVVASDGECRATAPSTDPALTPFQIAVLLNYPPEIIHVPVEVACAGDDISIEWQATDQTDALTSTCLYYRRYGTLMWTHHCVESPVPQSLSMIIPGVEMTVDGVEYYLNATDNLGLTAYHGTADNPHFILEACPCIPTLISPSEGAVLDNGCQDQSDPLEWAFDWDDCIPVTMYHLYVHHVGSEFPLINDSTITVSSYNTGGYGYIANHNLLNWHWRVRAQVNGTWGAWSEERTFEVEPLNTDCVVCPQPDVSLVGYITTEYVPPLWKVQVEVANSGPGVAKDVNITMNSDIPWLVIPDPTCGYGDIPDGATALGGSDTYTFDLTSYPGGSFNVWFDVTYSDSCGNQYQDRLDPEFDVDSNVGAKATPIASSGLSQNYPNPFNPNTTISYQISESGHVRLGIFDMSGRLIRTQVNGNKGKGLYSVEWNGKDNLGKSVSSGIYFYKMESGDYVETKKMVLLR